MGQEYIEPSGMAAQDCVQLGHKRRYEEAALNQASCTGREDFGRGTATWVQASMSAACPLLDLLIVIRREGVSGPAVKSTGRPQSIACESSQASRIGGGAEGGMSPGSQRSQERSCRDGAPYSFDR